MNSDRELDGKNSIFNRVKAKNLNLTTNEYNTITNKINSKGLLLTNETLYKNAQQKRTSIIARLDTDIHTNKTKNGYDANIGVEKINELKGVGKEIQTNTLRNKYIEKGSPQKTKNSKHKIEHNPRSLTISKYRLERALKNTKDYPHKKILNSVPINKGGI